MYRYLSRLVIYRNIEKNSILFEIADILERWQKQKAEKRRKKAE
jgi:hypothetical protein